MRFHVLSHDDPQAIHANNYEALGLNWDWRMCSVLLDTHTNGIVYVDEGEPEDQTLGRDQRVLVDLLNELAARP